MPRNKSKKKKGGDKNMNNANTVKKYKKVTSEIIERHSKLQKETSDKVLKLFSQAQKLLEKELISSSVKRGKSLARAKRS